MLQSQLCQLDPVPPVCPHNQSHYSFGYVADNSLLLV